MKRQLELINGRLSARPWMKASTQAGKASRYIHDFSELQPGDRVFLACRKSGRERPENLVKQEANLRRMVKVRGAIIAGCYKHVGSGFDPFWIRFVVTEAKREGAKWIIAESTDRLIRNRLYHSKLRPNFQATEEQLQELAECAKNSQLMTYLHPDSTPKEVRSYQRKRGGAGRPASKPGHKKRRRWQFKLPIIRLCKQGLGNREIARQLALPEKTVRDWRMRYHKYWVRHF